MMAAGSSVGVANMLLPKAAGLPAFFVGSKLTESYRAKVIDITSQRRQKRVSESFEASIRETWPGPLILEARKAIKNRDYTALDQILSRLERYP